MKKLNLIVLSVAAAFIGRPAALCTANAEESAPTDNSPLALMARGADVDLADVRWRVAAGLDPEQAVEAALQQKLANEAAADAAKKKTKKGDKEGGKEGGNALTAVLAIVALIFGLSFGGPLALRACASPAISAEIQQLSAPTIDVASFATIAAPQLALQTLEISPAIRWTGGILVSLLALAACGALIARTRNGRRRDLCSTANAETAAGTHRVLTLRSDAAHSHRHLLVKSGSDARHAALCGAGDYPIGSTSDSPDAAEDIINAHPLGSSEHTRLLRSSASLNANVDVYTAANGFIQAEPTTAGTYFKVGRTVAASVQEGSSNFLTEVAPCDPLRVVVVAALTSTNGTAAAAADLNALKAETEKVGDDLRSIAAALSTPSLVKVLAS